MKLILENWNRFLLLEKLDDIDKKVLNIVAKMVLNAENALMDKEKKPFEKRELARSILDFIEKDLKMSGGKCPNAELILKNIAASLNTNSFEEAIGVAKQLKNALPDSCFEDGEEPPEEPEPEELETVEPLYDIENADEIDAMIAQWEADFAEIDEMSLEELEAAAEEVAPQVQQAIQQAETPEEKIEIAADFVEPAAEKLADEEEVETVAQVVLDTLDDNISDEVVDAVVAKVEEPAEEQPQETSEKLRQFQDSEFYKAIQDDEAKQGLSFIFKYFIDNQIISEGLKDVVVGLGIKPADLRKALMALKQKEESIFKKIVAFLKDENNTNEFVDVMKNFIPQPTDVEEPEPEAAEETEPEAEEEPPAEEDETVVDVGGDEFVYSEEDISELKNAYKQFESQFMNTRTLRQQEELWVALRDALNNIGQFRPIAGDELALTENLFEQENEAKIKRLVVDLERLRKDLNDTDKTLSAYIGKAEGGKYEAKAYMARFLAELKDVQNSIGKSVADTKSLLNIEEGEVLSEQEETREQKIQNVRNVYEGIKDLLGGILPELDRTVAAQQPEISANIKSSYDELQKIRKYFRNVGAFAKTSDMDVSEIKRDYLNIKQDITKSMSRVIDDLRRNRLTGDVARPFLIRLGNIGSFIMETFGVGPDSGYEVQTIDVPSDGKSKEEIASDTSEEGSGSLSAIPEEVISPEEVTSEVKFIEKNRAIIPFLKRMHDAFEDEEEIDFVFLRDALEQLEGLNLNEQKTYQEKFLEFVSLVKNKDLSWFEKNATLVRKITKDLHNFYKIIDIAIVKADREIDDFFNATDLSAELEKLQALKQGVDKYLKSLEKEKTTKNKGGVFGDYKADPLPAQTATSRAQTFQESNQNLLEKLIKEELRMLNGKKMVRN